MKKHFQRLASPCSDFRLSNSLSYIRFSRQIYGYYK